MGFHNSKLDGTPINVEVMATALNYNGKPSVQVIVTDITERKRAEAALYESQMQLEGIFNSTMDAIITVDEDQKIVIFNPAAEQMFRCPASEAIGGTLDRFIPEYYRDRHKESISAFEQSNLTRRSMKSPTLTFTSLRANGETFPSEVSISQLETGGKKLYTAIVRDITERKRAEETLLESELKFRTLFDRARDGILIADLEMRQFFMGNRAICRMLGYTHDELSGVGIDDIHPWESLSYVLEQFKRQARGEIELAEEIPVKRKDGSVFYADINSTPVTLGGQTYMMGVFRDITERKQAKKP